jgi:hypothetical protein
VAYSYITLGELRSELLNRLQDSGAVNCPAAEADLYLIEGLRVLNAQTAQPGTQDYLFNFNAGDTWKTLNVAGSPRQRTVTDADLYAQMEAMLYEPMSGGTWTGTTQYNIDMLSGALQYRRDELLLQSAANVVNLLQPSPLLAMRTFLPDSTLNLHRVRWIPVDSTTSSSYALGREDVVSRNADGVNLSIQPGEPDSWMITANAPLAFDCSCPPNQPGEWDMLASFSGESLIPPAPTVLGLPNDWCWVALYGALADVLANAPEGRDASRAKYCMQRYEQGKKAMLKLPWLLQATVASIPVDTPGFRIMDTQQQNWEETLPADDPQVVVGGVDLVALGPNPTGATVSAVLTVVGNAPVPVDDASEIQLSRDGVDAVLAYAQHAASFKQGGRDFAVTFPLLEQFEAYCRMKNEQYAALGIFRPDMLLEGNRNEMDDPRFEGENAPEGRPRGRSRSAGA